MFVRPSSSDSAGAPKRPDRRATRRIRSVAPLVMLMALNGCYDQIAVPDEESDGRATVRNDEEELGDRVSYPDDDVPIDPDAPGLAGMMSAAPPALAPSAIRLRLVAEVLPPTVGGEVVQATSLWATRNDRAIVSYNVRGAPARGALDYFSGLTNRRPRLRSSIHFIDSDVSSVFVDDSWAYAATATSDVTFAAPAVLERVEIQGSRFRLGKSSWRKVRRVACPSSRRAPSRVAR